MGLIHKRFLSLAIATLIGSGLVGILSSAPAYAAPATNGGNDTHCAAEKIGWIICPVLEKSATIGDNLFSFLADNFLQTEPELVNSDPKNGTRVAWEDAKNIANLIFVIAFIAIIYSQITGSGLSNYGIKKMLPKLILTAIFVNISYWICQGMVDISNIMGYEIKNAMVEISTHVSDQQALSPNASGGFDTQHASTLGRVMVIVLALAAFVWIFIAMGAPLVMLIIVTCMTIIIILLLRKAFIVLLIVASPIAFACYLLPNTEKLFTKWLKMFWQLLMVFPVVALLFGGGQLASAIILTAGTQSQQSGKCDSNGNATGAAPQAKAGVCFGLKDEPCVNLKDDQDTSGDCGSNGSGGPGVMLALVAAGIAVAPMLAVWAVLKGALSAAGAIGGKIASSVQKGTGATVGSAAGGIGKAGGAAKGAYQNSTLGKVMARNNRIAQGQARDGDVDGLPSRRFIKKMRARANRRLDNTTAFGEQFSAQRGRDSQARMAERVRNDTQDLTGGDYQERMRRGIRRMTDPNSSQADRREAEIDLRSAMGAARQSGATAEEMREMSRLSDRDHLQRTREVRGSLGANVGGTGAQTSAAARTQTQQRANRLAEIRARTAPGAIGYRSNFHTAAPSTAQAGRLAFNTTGGALTSENALAQIMSANAQGQNIQNFDDNSLAEGLRAANANPADANGAILRDAIIAERERRNPPAPPRPRP